MVVVANAIQSVQYGAECHVAPIEWRLLELSFYCVFLYDFAIPVTTIFDDAALGGIVGVDDAEALVIADSPFKVVHEGPDEVAEEGNAFADGLMGLKKVFAQVVEALGVVYLIVFAKRIGEGRAVFGDVDGGNVIFVV